jgi:hypothetical protein
MMPAAFAKLLPAKDDNIVESAIRLTVFKCFATFYNTCRVQPMRDRTTQK